MTPRNVIIFGCGMGGSRAFATLSKNESLIAFSDNDANKQGTIFEGKPVIPPCEITKSRYDLVLIASQYSDAICQQLITLGIPVSNIEIVARSQLINSSLLQQRLRSWKLFAAVYLLRITVPIVREWKRLSSKLTTIMSSNKSLKS